MSAISEKVRIALYSKLNVSGVTSLCNGVFESLAPDNTATPYVIFQRQGPGPVLKSFAGSGVQPTDQMEDDLWLIKAVTDEDSDTTKSPQKLAEDILAACRTALGSSLSLSGNTCVYYARFSDMPPYQEPLNDRMIYHRGEIWRIAVS